MSAPTIRFQFTVVDTPDPRVAAEFYGALLGVAVDESASREGWVQLEGEADGVATLAFQAAPGLVPPSWPDGEHPPRMHLDLEVGDLDEGESRALAAGARKATPQPGERFRVFLDPSGHPFCLVLARGSR